MLHPNRILVEEIVTVARHPSDPRPQKRIRYGNSAPEHQLVYKLDGENDTFFNGQKLHMKPDILAFLPKGEAVDYYVERVSHGDCIDVYFRTNVPMSNIAFAVDTSSHRKIKRLFLQLHTLWLQRNRGYYYKSMALLYEIIGEMAQLEESAQSRTKDERIEKGVAFLHRHYLDNKIDYYEPARLSGVSYTYFKQLFKQRYGVSPIEHVTGLKMKMAVELMATNRYRITEIAGMCGYSDVYYFSKVFKKYFGSPPSRFAGELHE